MNVTEYRNIAEQVQKNKDDILNWFKRQEVLSTLSIRIKGRVEYLSELPIIGNEIGDTWAVGTEEPYNYYIYVDDNQYEPENHWFEFGKLFIEGPQGPQGEKGEQGEIGSSTKWLIGTREPIDPANEYDIYLNINDGYVYQFINGVWVRQGNLKGSTGPSGRIGDQGPRGERGPAGPMGPEGSPARIIKIAGQVSTVDALPEPDIVPIDTGYLVGAQSPYNLYIKWVYAGVSAWHNVGPFNQGTAVTVDGQFVSVFDADTKLNKISSYEGDKVYVNHFGEDTFIEAETVRSTGTLVMRDQNTGTFQAATPILAEDVTTKEYVDDLVNNSLAVIPLGLRPGGGENSTVVKDSGNASVGARSLVIGTNNSSATANNFVYGEGSEAAIGSKSSLVGGKSCKTTGSYGVALGRTCEAGAYAFAVGNTNTVTGGAGGAIGIQNTVTGGNSIALGAVNNITDAGSVACGSTNQINTKYSFTAGTGNYISGSGTHGYGIGSSNTIQANAGNGALGSSNNVSGAGSWGIGRSNAVNGNTCVALGSGNIMSGTAIQSVACGNANTIEGLDSFAAGVSNTIHNQGSLVGGFAIGSYLDVNTSGQLAVGKANDDTSNALFVVGNGYVAGNEVRTRVNAFEVMPDNTARVRKTVAWHSPEYDTLPENTLATHVLINELWSEIQSLQARVQALENN